VRATSRGFGIHYTVDGDGPPLVLVPGTLLAARHWTDFGYADALSRDWRVIAIDPLGHGRSDRPHESGAYRPADVTADLVAVLDAEGVPRATVWGYSRGGWLAVNLAARYPQRVERLVVGAYAMHAHEEEVDRILVRFAEMLSDGDWAAVWEAFGITDTAVRAMLEEATIRARWRRRSPGRCARPDTSTRRPSPAPPPITSAPWSGSCRTFVLTSPY
jgi:pimeloyl-ACP methyl ester carboxylesterase